MSTWQALLLAALCGACGNVSVDATTLAPATHPFTDPFDVLDPTAWACEFGCPTVESGVATFTLSAGAEPSTNASWSKLRYLPRQFTAGSFTVRFALDSRPKEPVFWGVALYTDGPRADQSESSGVYFGYRTDGSLSDSQLLLETTQLGRDRAIPIDTGGTLYDGTYHTGKLVYDATHIDLYFDDELVQSITDRTVIPTAPLDFYLGTRLVTTPVLASNFDVRIDSCKIEW